MLAVQQRSEPKPPNPSFHRTCAKPGSLVKPDVPERQLSKNDYGSNGPQLPLRNVYQICTLIFR